MTLGAPAGGKLPRVQPYSAFGVVICCVGYVWTVISYFQVCGAINLIDPSANLQGWTLFVPIYQGIYFTTVIQKLNGIIASKGLSVPPLADNVVLNFLVPVVSIYNIFNKYNEVANAIEGTTPVTT